MSTNILYLIIISMMGTLLGGTPQPTRLDIKDAAPDVIYVANNK